MVRKQYVEERIRELAVTIVAMEAEDDGDASLPRSVRSAVQFRKLMRRRKDSPPTGSYSLLQFRRQTHSS